MAATEKIPVAQDILSYLVENKTAEDTIDGIVEWWLMQERIKRRTKEVRKALDELLSENLIIARESKDSKIYYRINPRKIEEIETLLKARGERT